MLEFLQEMCRAVLSPSPLGFVKLAKVSYLFMSFVPGSTLYDLWPELSQIQKKTICSKLDSMLAELRNIPHTPCTPLGTLVAPHLCKDTRRSIRQAGQLTTESQFNNFLLRNPLKKISMTYLTWLRSRLRDDHRIVLMHGDLNPKNLLLVGDNNGSLTISGIIDWELS